MKTKLFYMVIYLPVLIVSTLTVSYGADSVQTARVYYAIEVNDVLCGYFEAMETPIRKDGRDYIQSDANVFAMLSVLGSSFNQEMKIKSLVDPITRRCFNLSMTTDQGTAKYNFELKVENDSAYLNSSLKNQTKTIALSPEIITGNDEVFTKIKKDFIENKQEEVSYDILEMMEEEIQKSTFKKIGEEKLELVGNTYNTIIIEQTNIKTNLKTKYWLAPECDYYVKFEVQNRKIYLADRSVVDKIKVANMDASFFTKTNVSISDLQSISYMKLKIKIEPTGVNLKNEDLNVPGQRFEGTVTNNIIEGVLEIEHKKYDGSNAPPFPPDFIKDESLKKYLMPDRFIESDDNVLISKANEITTGSKDSWEAAKRLSKWVAENISYAIPGGVTARNTYDIRAGECGAHSMLLAAFCRAVEIPSRVVFGAMYAPNFGGGFGQHGWNEIYMGDAGWIPVDATAHEIDYIDAGHIRISEVVSITSTKFNGKAIEVLDYKLGDKSSKQPVAATMDFTPYLGKYSNLESGRTFTVLEKDGNLSLDVPGQTTLPFNPPNDKNRWQCKIAPHLSVLFNKDDDGKIAEMILHQILSISRKSVPEKIDENIPKEFIPYLGTYLFAAINNDFTVLVNNGKLAVYDPTKKDTVELQSPDQDGGWLDEYNKNTVYFDKDSQGNVTGMKIETADKFKKGDLASNIVKKVIDSVGLEKGLKKYEGLKTAFDKEIHFSESSFNLLGYKYLNANKFNEAIEIFKLNVQAYPKSFNTYGSLAEAYVKNNQNELATENYKKSLELNPNNDRAKKMLESLGVK